MTTDSGDPGAGMGDAPYRPGTRHASWLELFFDLVFVAVVAALARTLHEEHSVLGLAAFAALFVPLWWAWMGFTWYAATFDRDDTASRIGLICGMLAAAAAAATIPGLPQGRSTGFVLAYTGLLSVLAVLYLHCWLRRPEARPLSRALGISNLIGAALWLVSLALPHDLRPVVWVAAMVQLITAFALAPWSTAQRPYDRDHVAERYGLFTLIVLGESVVATVAGLDSGAGTLAALVAVTGFLIAATVWWLYFGVFRAMPDVGGVGTRFVWAQGHLLVFAGIAAAAVGVEFAVEAAAVGEPLEIAERLPLGVGLAAYLVAMAAIRGVTRRIDAVVALRAGAAAALALVAVSGLDLPPLAFVSTVAAVLVAEAGLEGAVRHRAGRAAAA